MEVIDIETKFKDLVFKDKKASELRKLIQNGGSFEDVEEYAKRLAELVGDAMKGLPDGTDIVPFIKRLGEIQRKYINNAAAFIQNAMNKELGMELNALTVKSTQEVALKALEKKDTTGMTFNEVIDSIINQQITQNLKQVDSFIRTNASFQSRSGLKVKVSRYYDDVGLRNRTQKCAWCLERCGVEVPYAEAVNMGMFERHEGCGCKIVYKSERTSYQTKKGAWKYE